MLRDEIAFQIASETEYTEALKIADAILALLIDDVVTIGDVLRMWENGDLVFKELHPELPALVELQRDAERWRKVETLANALDCDICERDDGCPQNQCGLYSAMHVKEIVEDAEDEAEGEEA